MTLNSSFYKKITLDNALLFLVIMFVVNCATTQLFSFIPALSVLLKIIQAISLLFVFIIFIVKVIVRPKITYFSMWNFGVLLYLFFILIWSVVFNNKNITTTYAFMSFFQIFFMYFWFFAFDLLNVLIVGRMIRYVYVFSIFTLIISLCEFLIPTSIRLVLLNHIFQGSIPGAYFSRDVTLFSDGLRLGSIFLSPLTFSYACILVLTISFCLKNKWITKISLLLSIIIQVKTALAGQFIVLSSRFISFFSKFTLFVMLSGVFIVSYYVNPVEILAIPNASSYKSVSNHLVGLSSGIRKAVESPFSGDGLGRSGFVVYLESKKNNFIVSPFKSDSEFLNGNESTLGVMAYQTGLIFVIFHFSIYYYLSRAYLKQKKYAGFGFLCFILLFQIFSESAITSFVVITSSLVLIWIKNENSIN